MKSCVIISNAMSDSIRRERDISTDSPAASRKVFMWAELLKTKETKSYILSLGRGRTNNDRRFFRAKIERTRNVVTLYLPFSHIPIFSEMLTLFSLPWFIFILARRLKPSIIYYNRMPAYIVGALLGRFLKLKQFIDIEDGEINNDQHSIKKYTERVVPFLIDKCCNYGAFLACSNLSSYTKVRPIKNYYGVVDPNILDSREKNFDNIHIVFSGTLTESTGAERLVSAIKIMQEKKLLWANKLVISICGMGSSIDAFRLLSSGDRYPKIHVYGRLDNIEYKKILCTANVGLSLKLVKGIYSDTTFPSKVIEYASNRLFVVTTDISDVKDVLGQQGAYYLNGNSPEELVSCFEYLALNSEKLSATAKLGYEMVCDKMLFDNIRNDMLTFIFGRE